MMLKVTEVNGLMLEELEEIHYVTDHLYVGFN